MTEITRWDGDSQSQLCVALAVVEPWDLSSANTPALRYNPGVGRGSLSMTITLDGPKL
jgi:hypothetical protein